MRADESPALVPAKHLRRCPFCHDDVGRDDEPVVCGACLALHHRACWDEAPTCATCGSSDGLGRIGVRPASVAPKPAGTRDRFVVPPSAELGAALGELRQRESQSLRQWWVLLLPHLYVPFFWPLWIVVYFQERSAVRLFAEKARWLLNEEHASLDPVDLGVLDRAEKWAAPWF